MDPFTIMLVGGVIAAAIAAAKAKSRVLPGVDPRLAEPAEEVPPEIAEKAEKAADKAVDKLSAGDVVKAGLMKALPIVGALVAIHKIVSAIGEARQEGRKMFKLIWPLMDPAKQREWVRRKMKSWEKTHVARRLKRHQKLLKLEQNQVSKFGAYTEEKMRSALKINQEYKWWTAKRPTFVQVKKMAKRVIKDIWEKKPVAPVVAPAKVVEAEAVPPTSRIPVVVTSMPLITPELIEAAAARAIAALAIGSSIEFVNKGLAEKGIRPASPGRSPRDKGEAAYQAIAGGLEAGGFVEITENRMSSILKRPPTPQVMTPAVRSVG